MSSYPIAPTITGRPILMKPMPQPMLEQCVNATMLIPMVEPSLDAAIILPM